MGKGKRLRAQARTARPRREMADDRPYLDEPIAEKPAAFARQELDVYVHAALFVLNYLAFAEDGTLEIVPPEGPREGESEAETRARLRAEMAVYEVRRLAGDWRELCADELRHIPPSWAQAVATWISRFGQQWLDAALARDATIGRPDAQAWVRGARPLLGTLCPSQHWEAALDLMDVRATATDPEWMAGADHPVGLIHAAAAMTTWLFQQPEIVSDPHATKLDLIDRAQRNAGEPSVRR